MTLLNRDYSDILRIFNAGGVEYLLVGAYALAAHGRPRATGDIDLWIRCTPTNAQRTWDALVEFGAPLMGLAPADLATPEIVFQIGVEPRRIDVLTTIDGVEFESAWSRHAQLKIDETPVPVIGFTDLLANKRASGRPKDLGDVAWLESQLPPRDKPAEDG